MLPIDSLKDPVAELLRTHGEDPDRLLAVLHLDGGKGGHEVFLALTDDRLRLLSVLPACGQVDISPIAEYSQPYVDSQLSTCRLLAVRTPPEGEARTVCLGDGSGACRDRLFVFLAVLEATLRGEELSGSEAMFDPLRPKSEARAEKKRTLSRFLSLMMPHRRLFLLTFLFLGVEMGVDLLRPYLTGTVLFDSIISPSGAHHTLPALFLCLGAVIGLALLRWLAITLRNVLVSRTMSHVTEDLRLQVFAAIGRQSFGFLNRTPLGRLFQSLGGDVNALRFFFGAHLISFIIYAVEFIAVGALLFILNWRLSLLILVPIPLIVLIYRRAFPALGRLNTRASRENSALSTRVNDSLSGFRVVKAFAREEDEIARLSERLDRLYRVNLRANLFSALLGPAVALLIYLANQTVWGLGGLFVMEGSLTYGDFCTYLGYIGMIFTPLNFFSSFAMLVGQASESAARVFSVLDAPPEITDPKTPRDPGTLRGEIELCGVRFHYTPNRPILRGVNLHIAAGEHIGLVGQTGCGKSTVANLLLRMYDVTGGSVKIDGIDVRDLPLSTLRRSIAIVSQEVHLFRASVTDNIRFARPDATEEEVMAAARAAGAHDFIMAMADGYNTVIGGGGRTLSGGECQRISIARAIITQPRILILDEATAAMDNATEQRIAAALDLLTEGRTTISIAHRLSTLAGCDRIMAMDGGRIVESGTQQELLEKGGIFKKLYTLQSEQLLQVIRGETEHDE